MSGTGTTHVADLATAGQPLGLTDGDVLVREGDPADDVFVVTAGRLVASIETDQGRVVLASLERGDLVGDVTAVAGGLRTATVTADGPAEVSRIDRTALLTWLDDHPEAAAALVADVRRRLDRTRAATLGAALVGDADSPAVDRLLDGVEWRHLAAGDVLFAEGDRADAAYLVVGGRLAVSRLDADGERREMGEIGRGDIIGELGLLDGQRRTATVRAVRDATLAALSRPVLEGVAADHPAVVLRIAGAIVERASRPIRYDDRGDTLAIAAAGPIDPALLDALLAEIGRHGSVDLLCSGRVDALLGRPGLAQAERDDPAVPRIEELLHVADRSHDRLVLVADDATSPWNRRILRHADRVLVVTTPDAGADELARARELLDGVPDGVARMLGVVHPPTTDRPRGTAGLLSAVDVDEVVHVRDADADDLARLARLAIGRGVGLLLSGGGARGFAHLGAYRALVEAGVPVDMIGGCSIGAPLGGGIAQGVPRDQMIDVTEGLFHRLLDFTVPVVSLLKGERISRNIASQFGDWDLEDLWLPFFCVSTDLTAAELVVHRRGPAALAVRASVSIPGVLPPVPHDGHLLVDGAVLDNLPITEMRDDRTIGTVVAVDVAPPRGPRAKSDFGTSVSGIRAAVGALTPWGQRLPDATGVMMRSMLTGSARHQQELVDEGAVDLFLPVHVPTVGLLDFEAVREGAEAGHRDTVEAVGAWAADRPWERGR